MDICAKSLVEEFKNFIGCVDFVRADKPFILLFVEFFSIVSLYFGKRDCKMGDCLESVLEEISMVFLGVEHHAKEYRS